METKEITKIKDVEVWKEVTLEDFKHYLVSNKGRVKNGNTNYILKENLDSYGYPIISLCNKGIQKTKTIHRLVAQAFIPNPENLETVNHIDGKKTNNNVSNLEWLSMEDNLKHAHETGLMDNISKDTKWIENHVEEIKDYLLEGYSIYRIADVIGCHYRQIKKIKNKYKLTQKKLVRKPHTFKISEKEIENCYELFKQGSTFKELVEERDYSRQSLARILRVRYGKEHIDEILKQNKKK